MKYYKLDLVSDPKIIGVNNGIAQTELDQKRHSDKQYLDAINDFFSGINWWDRDPVPSINIEFYAKKIKGVILTDFLSFSLFFIACPFIINNAVFFPGIISTKKSCSSVEVLPEATKIPNFV